MPAESAARSPSRIPALVHQVGRFVLVGGLAAVVDFGVLSLIIYAGGSRYWGRIVSVAVAMVFTWVLNRTLTFATPGPPTWREFTHYIATAIVGVLLNLAIYWTALRAGLPTWAAFVLGTGLVTVFSFLRYRAILHRPR